MQFDKSTCVEVSGRAAGVVILDEQQRILLVKENQGRKKGLWHIPSGSVEPGESVQAAAMREAFEETGLQVELGEFIGAYIGRYPDGGYVLRHAWLASVPGKAIAKPHLADEIAEARYFTKKEFNRLYEQRKIRMHHTRMFYEAALALVVNR